MSAVKIACAVAVGFVIVGMTLGKKTSPSASPAAAAAPQQPELKVGGFNCSNQYGFTTTEGTVRNMTDKPIQNLMVVSMHYSQTGKFVKSDSAMVEYQPLMPGQSSPFKTISPHNPMMYKCNIGFKRMFGGEVSSTM